MNIKNFSVGAIAVVLLALVGFSFKPSTDLRPGYTVAAVSSPDIPSPYFSYGDVRHWAARTTLALSTTTPCAIQSPAATTTVISTGLQITTASSTATTWTAAIGTSAFATTTQLKQFSLGSGALGTMFVTSTTTWATDAGTTVSPNTWIVWSVAGLNGSFDSTKLNGVCQAEFLAI